MSPVKKKKVVEEPTSKTARASMKKGQKKDEGFKASGEMPRIISLNNGDHAYLLDPRDGRTHHLAVGSQKWFTLIAELADTPHWPGIHTEIQALGWAVAEERNV